MCGTLCATGLLWRSRWCWSNIQYGPDTLRFCIVGMAQVADSVQKTQGPQVEMLARSRIHLGRCDSPGAIRRASKRITQALLDGRLDRETHNGAQYGLALMLKASEAEREERANQPRAGGRKYVPMPSDSKEALEVYLSYVADGTLPPPTAAAQHPAQAATAPEIDTQPTQDYPARPIAAPTPSYTLPALCPDSANQHVTPAEPEVVTPAPGSPAALAVIRTAYLDEARRENELEVERENRLLREQLRVREERRRHEEERWNGK